MTTYVPSLNQNASEKMKYSLFHHGSRQSVPLAVISREDAWMKRHHYQMAYPDIQLCQRKFYKVTNRDKCLCFCVSSPILRESKHARVHKIDKKVYELICIHMINPRRTKTVVITGWTLYKSYIEIKNMLVQSSHNSRNVLTTGLNTMPDKKTC